MFGAKKPMSHARRRRKESTSLRVIIILWIVNRISEGLHRKCAMARILLNLPEDLGDGSLSKKTMN